MDESLIKKLEGIKKRLDNKEPMLGREFKDVSMSLVETEQEKKDIKAACAQIQDDKEINSKMRRQLKKVVGAILIKERWKPRLRLW